MNINEINEKIKLIEEKIEAAQETIKLGKETLESLREEKNRILEPKFERRKGGIYFTVAINKGMGKCFNLTDNSEHDSSRYENNNYFLTRERAEEVADKFNFLLKLERFHDIYCPDYVPNWEDDEEPKWYIYYDVSDKVFVIDNNTILRRCVDVYFDSLETANKVCEILSKEYPNGI